MKRRLLWIAVAVLGLPFVLSLRTPPSAPPARARTEPTLSGFPNYAATVKGSSIEVKKAPSASSQTLTTLASPNENDVPTTFLIRGERSVGGQTWYRVLLPIRPNGSAGWVSARSVDVSGLRYRITVHLSTFRLDLASDGRVLRTFPIGEGTDQTPTPGGEYYVKERITPPNPDTIYGRQVLGLSGFSNVLVNWPGGGVLGIHGTNDPSTIGRKVSHGCIRMANDDIESLASLLPLGTPVTITA